MAFEGGGGQCPNNNNLPPTLLSAGGVMDHNGLNRKHCQQMYFFIGMGWGGG